MQNNNYLSLINFKVKLFRQYLFMNKNDVGGSNLFERFKKTFEPPTSCLFV